MSSPASSAGEKDPRTDDSHAAWWTRAAPWIIFALTSVAFMFPALAIGGTFGASDLTLVSSPYREYLDEAYAPGNTLQTDLLAYLPQLTEFWRSARQGTIQLWEPDLGGGMPLFPAMYHQILVPWHITFLFLPEPIASTVAVALGLFVGQAGTYLFARRLGLGRIGATVAAVGYVFSGPVTAFAMRIQQTLMLPWLMLGLHGAMTAKKGRSGFLALTSVSTAAVWLAGFPAGALFVMYLSAAFVIYLVARRPSESDPPRSLDTQVRSGAAVSFAILVGTAIAAFQVLPTYEFIQVSGGLEREYPLSHRAGLGLLASAISGRFFGTYQNRDWWWPDPGYSNPYEASFTAGLLVMGLLALVAFRLVNTSRPVEASRVIGRFLVPTGLLVVVGTYLGGPVLWLIQQLPFLGDNSFGRSRFIASFAFALFAGLIVDNLRERVGRGSYDTPTLVGGAIILGLVGLGVNEGIVRASQAQALGLVAKSLLVPLAVSVFAVVVILIHRRWPTEGFLWLMPLLLAVELQFGAWGFVPASPPEAFYPYPSALDPVVEEISEGGHYRILPVGLFGNLAPHTAGLLDVRDARFYLPVTGRYEDLVLLSDDGLGKRPGDPFLVLLFSDQFDPRSPALDAMSVRYVAYPLRDPLPGIGEVTRVTAEQDGGSLRIEPPPGSVRSITVAIDRDPDCATGWVELSSGGHTSRRLARELGPETVFPLPDVPGDSLQHLVVTSSHCDIEISSPKVGLLLVHPEDSLRLISVDGWALFERPAAAPRAHLAAGVTRIDDAQERLALIRSAPPNERPVILEGVDAEPGSNAGQVDLVIDEPDRVVVEVAADAHGWLVLRDVQAPGWRAELDGEPVDIITADHAFRAVQVPAGSSRVEFSYQPTSLTVGLGASGVGLVIVGVWTIQMLLAHRRRRSEP